LEPDVLDLAEHVFDVAGLAGVLLRFFELAHEKLEQPPLAPQDVRHVAQRHRSDLETPPSAAYRGFIGRTRGRLSPTTSRVLARRRVRALRSDFGPRAWRRSERGGISPSPVRR